jgi:hypothetical protein
MPTGVQCLDNSPVRHGAGRRYLPNDWQYVRSEGARGQCAAILASPRHELTGFRPPVDCLAPGCGGGRTHAVAELANFHRRD